jgi:crossover junction endodeoxyribonuclease RuvC
VTRKIIGIDPGSHRLGFACIEKKGSDLRLIFAEVITAPARDSLYPRLGVIGARLKELIELHTPDEVAVENIFHAKNARSAFHLGIARGIAISQCLERKIQIFEYAPTEVKAVVTGYGRADKAQVKKMIELTLGTKVDLGFDATDAIAVAICHASNATFLLNKNVHNSKTLT